MKRALITLVSLLTTTVALSSFPSKTFKRKFKKEMQLTAAWLAHVDERRTTVREVGVQDPEWTHTQGLKITEENVLPLL